MEFKQILKHIPISSCLNCGSFWTSGVQLCSACFRCLSEEQGDHLLVTAHEFGQAYSLYEWSPGESDMLSHLILWLKGRHQERAWSHYAELFLQKRMTLPFEERRLWIVTPPNSKARRHAFFWGHSLARQTGGRLIDPLSSVEAELSGKKQKERSLEQREQRRFILREEFTLDLRERNEDLWVFADDVLTSGSTAKAAFLALGSPPHFEVWCLGQRAALLRSLAGSVIKAE